MAFVSTKRIGASNQKSVPVRLRRPPAVDRLTETPMRSSCPSCDPLAPLLKGFITEADLPQAEQLWPGLQKFFLSLPPRDRPATFLELIWRFEACQSLHAA